MTDIRRKLRPDNLLGNGDQMEDIENMVPRESGITVGGRRLLLLPIKIRQLPGVLKHIGGLGPFMEAMDEAEGDAPRDGSTDQGELVRLLEAIAVCAGDLIGIVSAASDQPAEWVADLDPFEFIRLARKVMEVNAHFFGETLLERSGDQDGVSRVPGAISSST